MCLYDKRGEKILEETEGRVDMEVMPPAIKLLRAFLNTREIAEATDVLSSSEGLRRWLDDMELPGSNEDPAPGDVEWVVAIREALRDVLSGNNGYPVPWESVALLNRAARRSPLVMHFDEKIVPSMVSVDFGVIGAVGRIWEAIASAQTDGTWERLKACRRTDCRWIFFDRSKNRSATWCSTEGCGALMKSRAYRRRHAARQKTVSAGTD